MRWVAFVVSKQAKRRVLLRIGRLGSVDGYAAMLNTNCRSPGRSGSLVGDIHSGSQSGGFYPTRCHSGVPQLMYDFRYRPV